MKKLVQPAYTSNPFLHPFFLGALASLFVLLRGRLSIALLSLVAPLFVITAEAAGPEITQREFKGFQQLVDTTMAVQSSLSPALTDLVLLQARLTQAKSKVDSARREGSASMQGVAAETELEAVRAEIRRVAKERLMPVLEPLATMKDTSSAETKKLLADPRRCGALIKGWTRGHPDSASAAPLAFALATQRLEGKIVRLLRESALGELSSALQSVERTLGLLTKVGDSAGNPQIDLGELASESEPELDEPADALESLLAPKT